MNATGSPIFRSSLFIIPMSWIFSCSPLSLAAQDEAVFTDQATILTNQGIAQLLLHNDSLALQEFQRAETLHPSFETLFLIQCGQAIAWDRLGNHESAVRLLDSIDQTFQICEPSTDPSVHPDEEMEAIEFMQTIAKLAPSPDVHNRLLAYFRSSDHNAVYYYTKGHSSDPSHHSSKFWKKVRRICKEVLIRVISKYIEEWLNSHQIKD